MLKNSKLTWADDQRTTLIQKNPNKGTAQTIYRPITCLPMMWKILTAQIREQIYYSLTSHGLSPDEQKGCCEGSRGTAGLFYIDQQILNESKTRRKNLAMAWIDYKKAYDMAPHSWIINCPKMYQNIRWSHKFYRQNLDSGIDSRRKKISWIKEPKRCFSKEILTFHNCHDST